MKGSFTALASTSVQNRRDVEPRNEQEVEREDMGKEGHLETNRQCLLKKNAGSSWCAKEGAQKGLPLHQGLPGMATCPVMPCLHE